MKRDGPGPVHIYPRGFGELEAYGPRIEVSSEGLFNSWSDLTLEICTIRMAAGRLISHAV